MQANFFLFRVIRPNCQRTLFNGHHIYGRQATEPPEIACAAHRWDAASDRYSWRSPLSTRSVTPTRPDSGGSADLAISLKALTKRFGQQLIVDGLSFTVNRGECFGLLGPNGAGKTTTLRSLLGLTPFDAGSVAVLGHPIPQQARQARARIGLVPQQDNLDPEFSVAENLLVFGRYFGLRDADIRARIPELLAFASLTGKRDARIDELSGGMKRRLTLARALINEPDLLVLDEPSTGLDPQARHLIWSRLKALRAQGRTLLLTTHFMDEAERLCDRLIVIDNGRAIDQGAPHELIARHVEPEVVEVYGDRAQRWLASLQMPDDTRVEVNGETVFCYTRQPQPLLASLQSMQIGDGSLRFLHRPANLEDVFLRLTGRDLREDER